MSWPHLTHCALDAPAWQRGVDPSQPHYPFQARTPRLSRTPLTCCAPCPFPPPAALAFGFLVRSKCSTSLSSRLNLRRRRPRSQGDTPKRRCPVTLAGSGRPGEGGGVSPREAQSALLPYTEGPDGTLSLAATCLRSSAPSSPDPWEYFGLQCE